MKIDFLFVIINSFESAHQEDATSSRLIPAINAILFPLQNGCLPFNKFEFVVGWLLRECSAPFLFANALCHPTIQWRSGVYRLRWGGLVEEMKPKVKL
jgi:hypothetical protein